MPRSSFSKYGLWVVAAALLWGGCKKEELFSEVPAIELITFGPQTAVEFQDSIFFSISYTDGDGDLGENGTDDHNLIVTDSRIGVNYKYRIKLLVPNGANVPIKGVLNFSIPNTFITDGSNSQPVNYAIQVTDRAGHASNVVTAGPISIIK